MRALTPALLLATLLAGSAARAADADSRRRDDASDPAGAPTDRPTISLDPAAPQLGTLPGGVTPSFASKSALFSDWPFGFHAFLTAPLRMGLNARAHPADGQSSTVLHAPPRVPGDFEGFDYTGVVPNPWVQLNFSYETAPVTATVIIAARTISNASGYFNPPDQIGINDAFLTFRLPMGDTFQLKLNAGAFANQYGNMGEYDLGRYGTPLIGRVAGTGATATGTWTAGSLSIVGEAGFQGQFKKAPVGVEPAGWNGFADPNVGTSWAPHLHAAVGYGKSAVLSLHWLSAFSNDDRANPNALPDGRIDVLGADLRLSLGRFGHFFAGYADTRATSARAVSDVLRVLNAPGGKGLMDEYLDRSGDGTGALHTFGAQFDFSLGNFLRHPQRFEADGPDLVASLFTIYTQAETPSASVGKLKYGAELGYAMLRWLAISGRYDRVLPALDDDTQTHAIVTARLILHSDWSSRDQVVLQYSHWFNGSGTVVRDGYPATPNPTIVPDANVLSLSASMWF